MTKGIMTQLEDETCIALVQDYQAGVGINGLRMKYHIGQQRVIDILDAAGIARVRAPMISAAKFDQRRKSLVEQKTGLGRSPTATEWCYIAGIFDGEGYLGTTSRGDYFRLTIAQLYLSGLHEWLMATLGAGRISIQAGKNGAMGQFHLEAQRHIYEFCLGVAPFIIVKRRQIAMVLVACHERYEWPLSLYYASPDPHFFMLENQQSILTVPSDL